MATSIQPKSSTSPTTKSTNAAGSLLTFSPIEFEQKFSKEPFLIDHNLCDHPLFKMERILELVKTLPESCIEYNAGDIPISVEHAETPMNGLSPEETVRRIEECKSWIVLKYVEKDPEYQALLDQCLEELRPHTESIAPGMTQAQAFVFVTSPGSVTPYHIDPEHNFLLQVRGSKEVHQLNGNNKSILSEEELEGFYTDKGRNLKLDPSHETAGWEFDLQSGKGLHFPVTFPHWVKNGNAVSVSFSITFRTPDLDRRRANYQVNAALRERGYSPWPVGKSSLRDNIMYNGFRVMRKLKSLVGRSNSCDS